MDKTLEPEEWTGPGEGLNEGCEGLRMKIQPLVIPGLFGHVQLRAFPPQAWPHGPWRELVSLHPSLMSALRTALHPQFGAVSGGG